MKRILLALMFMFMVMGFASALDSLGIFKLDECISLKQGCANCTYNNISAVIMPNGTSTLLNVQMTKSFNDYNYTFCQTNNIGRYSVYGFGDLNGIPTAWSYYFDINPIGKEYTTSQSITYVLLIILSLLIFVASFYYSFKINSNNEVNEYGEITYINYSKYGKWGLWVISYISLMFILYFAWNISYAFLYFDSLSGYFSLLFRALIVLTYPIALFAIIYTIYSILKDKHLENLLRRGLIAK